MRSLLSSLSLEARHGRSTEYLLALVVVVGVPARVSAQSKMPGWEGHVQTAFLIDKHALKAPPEVEGAVAKLAAYLVEPAKADYEKVHSIYRWMTDRLTFDPSQAGTPTPEKVLQTRVANSEGYARLFNALCAEVGIEAMRIAGHARGPDSRPEGDLKTNHVWNAVKLDTLVKLKVEKRWKPVDVARGAFEWNPETKKWDKHYLEYYCFTPPERFVFTHFPEDPAHQFLPTPVSAELFKKRLIVPWELIKYGADPKKIQACLDKPDFRGFVKLNWDRRFPLLILDIPLEKHLKKGDGHEFYFAAPLTLRVIIGDPRNKTELARHGTVFGSTLRPAAGRFQLKLAGAKEPMVEYEVE